MTFQFQSGRTIHPTRLATTGNPNGQSLYHLLEVMGKEKTLSGLNPNAEVEMIRVKLLLA